LSRIKLGLYAKKLDLEQGSYPWENPWFYIAWEDGPWLKFEEYLPELKNLVELGGGKLAVVIVPYEPQLDAHLLADHRNFVLKPQKQLSLLCKKHDIPCLDLFPEFLRAAESGARLYRDGVHLNQDGHTLTASLIKKFLQDEELVPQDRLEPALNIGPLERQ
jgi:hypothetical protein